MKQRNIGQSNISVSEIGLGAMSLLPGNDLTNQYIIDQGTEVGINYVDTSDLYDQGKNEELLGKLLKSRRKEWIIGSKVGNRWREDGSGWDWVPSKAYLISAVEGSLKRLQTDYLDLYQLHGGMIEDPIDEIIEAFELLKDQGKILEYGLSSIRPQVFKLYAARSAMQSNMMQFSLIDRRPEEYLDFLEGHQISVFARGTLGQGLLIDKIAKNYLDQSVTAIISLQEKLKELANSFGVSPLALAINYPLIHQTVCSSIVGVRNKEQMKKLVIAIDELNKIPENAYSELLAGIAIQTYKDYR
ncbi:aldo/keto reductase [Sphingobacterium sp. HJSM2_6]|uniref:aldo/keto reductase n=1 Tax=Sphingobacterium sp. HJSM2_6 TaxID=3366264 RepID=UPI003BEA9C1D